jgi:hypothetical protein
MRLIHTDRLLGSLAQTGMQADFCQNLRDRKARRRAGILDHGQSIGAYVEVYLFAL